MRRRVSHRSVQVLSADDLRSMRVLSADDLRSMRILSPAVAGYRRLH